MHRLCERLQIALLYHQSLNWCIFYSPIGSWPWILLSSNIIISKKLIPSRWHSPDNDSTSDSLPIVPTDKALTILHFLLQSHSLLKRNLLRFYFCCQQFIGSHNFFFLISVAVLTNFKLRQLYCLTERLSVM